MSEFQKHLNSFMIIEGFMTPRVVWYRSIRPDLQARARLNHLLKSLKTSLIKPYLNGARLDHLQKRIRQIEQFRSQLSSPDGLKQQAKMLARQAIDTSWVLDKSKIPQTVQDRMEYAEGFLQAAAFPEPTTRETNTVKRLHSSTLRKLALIGTTKPLILRGNTEAERREQATHHARLVEYGLKMSRELQAAKIDTIEPLPTLVQISQLDPFKIETYGKQNDIEQQIAEARCLVKICQLARNVAEDLIFQIGPNHANFLKFTSLRTSICRKSIAFAAANPYRLRRCMDLESRDSAAGAA